MFNSIILGNLFIGPRMPEGDPVIYSWVVINRWGGTSSVSNHLNDGVERERGENFLRAITRLPVCAGETGDLATCLRGSGEVAACSSSSALWVFASLKTDLLKKRHAYIHTKSNGRERTLLPVLNSGLIYLIPFNIPFQHLTVKSVNLFD